MLVPSKTATSLIPGQNLAPIGSIVRLQVQTSSLKCGDKPHRWYNPEFIQAVPSLRLDDGGVTGLDGAEIADVHHRDHPQTKYRGMNGVSVGFTGHYQRMRSRYGDHLTDGIAGENILVETAQEISEEDLARGVVIVGTAGQIALTAVQVAPPCVEFSKFCTRYAADQRSDRVITETLQFLHEGMRGFYATMADGVGSPAEIAVGDTVYLVTHWGRSQAG